MNSTELMAAAGVARVGLRAYPLSEASDWVSVRLSPSCLDWLRSLGTLLLLLGQRYACGGLLPPLLP